MQDGPTLLSLLAAGLYALVALSCGAAALQAGRARAPVWHLRGWATLAFFFIVLLVMRVTVFEEFVRDSMRAVLRGTQAYDTRRDWQVMVVAAFGVVAAGVSGWLAYRAAQGSLRRPDLAVKLALGAGVAMCGLVALRLVSFHWIDRALNGPLKLNWLGDIGASLAVLAAALVYVRLLRSVRRGPPR